MDDTTTPEPTKSLAQSFEIVNYSGFAEKHYKLNLPIIIAALRKAKTQSVDIRFYGSHDEGQIEEVNIKPSLDPMPQVAVHSAHHVIGGGIESIIKTMNLDSAIEALVYDQIDMSFGGSWETEEGGGGHFTIDFTDDKMEFELFLNTIVTDVATRNQHDNIDAHIAELAATDTEGGAA